MSDYMGGTGTGGITGIGGISGISGISGIRGAGGGAASVSQEYRARLLNDRSRALRENLEEEEASGTFAEAMNAVIERKEEILQKLENGDTEESIQTGGESFTRKEWERMMRSFDKIQDGIREEIEQRAEEQAGQRAREGDESRRAEDI